MKIYFYPDTKSMVYAGFGMFKSLSQERLYVLQGKCLRFSAKALVIQEFTQ